MKVCVSVRDPVPRNLREGNLRSEGRWERQVLEACIQNENITDIYTVGYEWSDGSSICSKYKGKVNRDTAKDCLLIIQDFNQNIINQYSWNAILCNIFMGPWMNEIEDYKRLQYKYKKKLIMTVGFPNLFREEKDTIKCEGLGDPYSDGQAMGHLLKFTDRENIFLLPVPAAPYISQDNGWDRTQILWCWRTIFFDQFYENPLIFWSLDKLQQNSELTLKIIVGVKQEEIKLWNNGNVLLNIKDNISDLFWSQKVFDKYLDVKNRVHLLYSITWEQVLQEFSQTKILAVHDKFYGGPPIEAAMHGIPFIGTGKTGAMAYCPDYMYTDTKENVCIMLDKLLTDKNLYTQKADAYKNYVYNTYSFDAFNKNLNRILYERVSS